MVISLIAAILLYAAATVLMAGILWRIFRYATTPVPHMIAIAPVPRTRLGVVARMLRETLLFESLFRASRWTWFFGWIFHYALALVLLRHVYFVSDPVSPWMVSLFVPGDYAAWLMVGGLLGLLGRRVVVDRVRYVSVPSDYAMLLLFLLIGLTGLLLRYEFHVNIAGVREFMLGWMAFAPQALPESLTLYLHLAGVVVLALVFPFSKLIHFPGYFFSPSHNQRYDNTGTTHFPESD